MRRRIRLAILCAFLLGIAALAHAQDTGKSTDEYVKAAGGARALSRVQTLSTEGTVTGTGEGNSGTYTFGTRFPNCYYSELIVGDKRVIEAYNGKSAWREDTTGNPATMFSQDSVEMQAEAQIANSRLLNLKKNKLAVAEVGPQVTRRSTCQFPFVCS